MVEKKYEFGTKVYIQRPLVMGQVKQLIKALEGARITNIADPFLLIKDIGERLPVALAIVLTPEGATPRDKDLDALAGELEFGLSFDDVLRVIDDFFSCNDLLSLLKKFKALAERVSDEIRSEKPGSTASSPPSPEATSPAGTQSSGASH